jgi:hypothetical protein
VLGTGAWHPVVVDAASVYWATYTRDNAGGISTSTWSIMKMPLRGGTPTKLVSGSDSLGTSFAVDATSVYWTTWQVGKSSLMKAPLGGGAPITLASAASPIWSIAVDAAIVYWTTFNQAPVPVDAAVTKVPTGGGTAVTLATRRTRSTSSLFGITVDATSVYWLEDGAVMEVPLAGGTPTVLAWISTEPSLDNA